MTYEEARTKGAEMIYERKINLENFHEEVAKIYAQSCCEDLRHRCFYNPLVIWRTEEEIEIILP